MRGTRLRCIRPPEPDDLLDSSNTGKAVFERIDGRGLLHKVFIDVTAAGGWVQWGAVQAVLDDNLADAEAWFQGAFPEALPPHLEDEESEVSRDADQRAFLVP